MGRNERHYTMRLHDNCANGSRNGGAKGARGCKDAECLPKARKPITNRLRRLDAKRVITEALQDMAA